MDKTGLIHKLIDGEFSQDEEKAVLSDPALKEDLDSLRETIRFVENCERKAAPPSFASEVMRGLKPHTEVKRDSFRHFFFRKRVFRWNMAAAVAALFAVTAVGGMIFYMQKTEKGIPSLNQGVQMVTVRFEFYSPDAKSVSLAGDFNKWSVDEARMRKQGSGVWTIEIPLKPETYSYMFVIDGTVWAADPDADSFYDDGFGNKNSVVRVGMS